VVFQFADELEDLEGVETQVGQQLTPRSRINCAPAQSFENLNRVAFKPIKGKRGFGTRGGSATRGVGCVGQVSKCTTNAVFTPAGVVAGPLRRIR
jgi:hypothetical protein